MQVAALFEWSKGARWRRWIQANGEVELTNGKRADDGSQERTRRRWSGEEGPDETWKNEGGRPEELRIRRNKRKQRR